MLLFFSGAVAYSARAQVSATTTGSLNVAAALTVTKITDISFGTVTAGDGLIQLDPATGTTNIGTGTPSAGKFEISGDSKADIMATFSTTVILTEPNSSKTLEYDPSVIHGRRDDVTRAEPFTSGTTDRLSNKGKHYFWVGGDVFVNLNEPGGIYSGTFTLTVTYN